MSILHPSLSLCSRTLQQLGISPNISSLQCWPHTRSTPGPAPSSHQVLVLTLRNALPGSTSSPSTLPQRVGDSGDTDCPPDPQLLRRGDGDMSFAAVLFFSRPESAGVWRGRVWVLVDVVASLNEDHVHPVVMVGRGLLGCIWMWLPNLGSNVLNWIVSAGSCHLSCGLRSGFVCCAGRGVAFLHCHRS